MDNLVNAALASAPVSAPASVGDQVSMVMLKRAMDIQASASLQLIDALPQPPSTALATMGSLGSQLNTFA